MRLLKNRLAKGIGFAAALCIAVAVAFAQQTPPDNAPPRPLHAPHGPVGAQLPWMVPGTASNHDGRTFEHYGKTTVRIADLPDEFISGTENYRIGWCRGFLARSLGLTALPGTFTCHEDLRINTDGEIFLDMFAVHEFDHSSEGRPLRYHRRHPDQVRTNPNTRGYIGGRGLLRRLERSGGIDRVYRPSYRRRTLPRLESGIDPPSCADCLSCDLSSCNLDGYFSTPCDPNCAPWCGEE